MSRSSRLLVVACMASVLPAVAGEVRAADEPPPTAREQALEKRVDDLLRQVEDLSRRVGDGASSAGDELEHRISELETVTKKNKNGLFGHWSNGIRMDSADGAFKLRIGGRVQNDWSWFWNNQDLEAATGRQIEAGTEFRRARLHVGGTIYKNVDFMAEYDFAGGAARARQVWVGLGIPGVGKLQVGSFKEPFGLEENNSSLHITFIERSSPSEAFAPSFNTGAMLASTAFDERATWQFGAFRDADDFGNDTGNARSGEINYTARVAARPFLDTEGEQYLHLGAAASLRTPSNRMATFRSRGELRLAGTLLDTGALASDDVKLFEGEAAFVSGPFHSTAEHYWADVKGDAGGPDACLNGWAVSAGWFLTGESRPYKASTATFDRIIPKKNYDGDGGLGAWEVAARLSSLDLDDGGVSGGEVRTATLGVNWYLNPSTKFMLDWVRSHVKGASALNAIVARFQVDF